MSVHRLLAAIKILFFVLVIGTPLFFYKWSLYPYTLTKTGFFQAVIELLLALWLVLAFKDGQYRPRRTGLLWGLLCFLGVLTLTAFTGIDPARSFFSTYNRAFGVIAFYHLGALVLVGAALFRELPWQKIFYASIATSMATVGIALLQLGDSNLLLLNDLAGGGRPGATFGNPSFLAGYLLLSVFLATYYLLSPGGQRERRPAARIFLASAILIDTAGIFITQTRGDILALGAGFFTLVLAFAVQPPEAGLAIFRRRGFYAALAGVLALLAVGIWITRSSTVWKNVPGLDRLRTLSFSAESGDLAPRLTAWRAAWKGFQERPVLGWGPENFNVVFGKYYDPRALEFGYAETNFDKPHDIYLETLVSGGVLLFATYLFLLTLFLREARRSGDRLLFQIAIALLAAYLIRNLVLFDTVGPGLLLYLLFGYVAGASVARVPGLAPASAAGKRTARQEGQQRSVHQPNRLHPAPIAAAVAAALVLSLFLNYTALAASYQAWWAHQEIQGNGNGLAGVAHFRAAADSWSPYQTGFVQDYANTVAQAYFYDHSLVPTDEMKHAIQAMAKTAQAHPLDPYNHYLLANIYNLAWDIAPAEYLPAAVREAERALELSPNRQEILFYLAKTKSLEGKNEEALAIAKQALDLDPKVADSHYYYGMLAFAEGLNEVGYNEVLAAVDMGRSWKNVYEARVAADYFADAGHLTEAAELYKAALRLKPKDLESEMKLGAAYFLMGRADLARPYLLDAAARYNFRSSSQYLQYKEILDALGIPI